MSPYQILLTNDDGIQSPGLWAAAEALATIGYVHVVAPRQQYSGAGRSLPSTSDGIITPQTVPVNGKEWTVYAVGGTPAQTVLHALFEVLPERPNLLVSGINYGENVGAGITVSGTVGAAMEAASHGIPALAVSLETDQADHFSHSNRVDFSTAAYFTRFFGELMLARRMPPDVDLLKVDVPRFASTDTPWAVTRLSRQRYFEPVAPQRASWSEPGTMGYRMGNEAAQDDPDSDVYALRVRRVVSVTPLSLDLTSRVALGELEELLKRD